MRDERKQENSGADAIQINGDHNTVNTTVNNHTHHHQHDHQHDHTHHHTVHAHGTLVLQMARATPAPESPFALQAPPAPPARKPKAAPRPAYDITPAQRALLALMRPLPKPDRAAVMDWMRCEFGTSLVMDLTPAQVQRCRVQVLERRRTAGVSGV